MTRREEAEKLARQVYHCDMRFDACSYCQDSIDDIESALRKAEQRALREAALFHAGIARGCVEKNAEMALANRIAEAIMESYHERADAKT
jgi:hypothetical protein